MSVLVVAAHPDDECLGFGASGARFASEGADVRACFLSGDADARGIGNTGAALHDRARDASSVLGFEPPVFGQFPNIALNTVPHLALVQFIEDAIERSKATTVVTHHPGDVNEDHRQVARAAMAAARAGQRNTTGRYPHLQRLLHMEVLSSTDWQFAHEGDAFTPNTFIEITEQHLAAKVRALSIYEDVVRPRPHPRNAATLEALAVLRGSQAGYLLSEAFVAAHVGWELSTSGAC